MGKGKALLETESQVQRLEWQVETRDEKVKELEGQLREQRAAFRDLASGFEEEREQFEEERKRLASKVGRVRQMEFFADCWRRKVMELTDVSGKELREHEDSLQYRIGSISTKIKEFQKGRLVQSPEFEVPELGKVQFEFFPTGDVNSREGWCSLRLRVPDHTRLKWSAFIGKKRIGPRTDHFDQRQWWCRYGLLWLNFCPLSDVWTEISPETDTLLCGIEVHEILPEMSGAECSTPVEAAMPVPRDRPRSGQVLRQSSEVHDQSKGSVLGSRQKLQTSTAFPSLAGSVEVREYPSDDVGVSQGSSPSRGTRGAAWRGTAISQQSHGSLLAATTASTASGTALAGPAGSSLLPKAVAAKGSPTLMTTAPAGRQLTRPQSVPSMAWRKNSAQRHK